MRVLIDCHIHTRRCGHARGVAADYVAAAERTGLEAIVFTEHLPLPAGLDPASCYAMTPGSVEEYVEEVRSSSVGNPVQVVVGGEADWVPGRAEETQAIRAAARAAGVDVVMGSVHFLEGWAFDDPDLLGEWDARDVDAVWEAYFAEWSRAAASGEFDVMAHADLVKKFGHRPSADPRAWYEEAARAAARGGVIVEVSTAGLRKPVAELYPGDELLRAFRAAGVPATVGSDAHDPSEVGCDLERAAEALVRAGYDSYVLPLPGGERREYPL